MADFNALLNRSSEDAARPVVLPVGTWDCMVSDYKLGESAQKKTPFVEFIFNVIAPGEDIEPEALEGLDYNGKTLRDTFYLTEGAEFRLSDFLKNNFDLTGTYAEILPAAKGQAVKVNIGQRMGDPDPATGEQKIYTEVKSYAKA
jgi:hypothetical protein